VTLYGYARDPSTEPEESSAHVPLQRPAADDGAVDPDDLWGTASIPRSPAVGTASVISVVFPPADGAALSPRNGAPPFPDGLPEAAADAGGSADPVAEAAQAPVSPASSQGSGAVGTAAVGTATASSLAAPDASDAAASGDLSESTEAVRAAALAWSDPELDVPEIQPWDRRPLMVVLAAAAVLVLVAILSGVASANLFRPTVSWQEPGTNGDKLSKSPGAVVPPPADSDTITLSGVGDVIMGTLSRGGGGKIPPQNGQGFFDPVKSALASDLVMGNLETPLTPDTGASKCAATDVDCFQFFLPPSYAGYLHDAGFQVMNLANNHTNDMGPAGLANTRTALKAAGVGHTGAPNEITMVQVKGVKVAVLGFSVYSWGGNLNNIPAAVALVKKAAEQADLVVIQMQGGAEGADKAHVKPGHEFFVGEDRGDLIAFSHAVIDAGADVVFGHGPHIMRGMEFYKGRLIAYSLGNFCGYGVLNSAGNLGVGGVLKVTLHHDGTWAGGTLVATQMVHGGMVEPDPNNRALSFVGGLSTSDFGPTAATISATDGTITKPAAG
jgi:hypothetical protein